jgi:LPXTG-motif cell wall-anchored protein
MKRSTWVPSPVVFVFLGACDAETSLEPTPEVIRGSVCPRPHEDPDRISTGSWGTVTPISNGVEYQVNAGYTVTICAKGGSLGDGYNIVTVTGPESGTLLTPENAGGNIPDLSHYSVTDITESGTTSSSSSSSSSSSTSVTSTTTDETTTLTEVEVTTTEGGDTSTTGAGDTTTTGAGDTTTTGGGDTTTTGGGDVTTTTSIGEITVTTDPGATSTSGEGPPVTEGGGTVNPTTTVEVGSGDLTTIADGEGEGTLDPSQESSTTGDEVAGGSDETLPVTGTGQVTLSGLAGMLLGAGAILLLLVRRRSRED